MCLVTFPANHFVVRVSGRLVDGTGTRRTYHEVYTALVGCKTDFAEPVPSKAILTTATAETASKQVAPQKSVGETARR